MALGLLSLIEAFGLFPSLDHLGRSHEYVRRNRQADLLRGLQIDDELKLLRLLDGKIGGLRTFENLVDVGSGAPKKLRDVRPLDMRSPESTNCRGAAINS